MQNRPRRQGQRSKACGSSTLLQLPKPHISGTLGAFRQSKPICGDSAFSQRPSRDLFKQIVNEVKMQSYLTYTNDRNLLCDKGTSSNGVNFRCHMISVHKILLIIVLLLE